MKFCGLEANRVSGGPSFPGRDPLVLNAQRPPADFPSLFLIRLSSRQHRLSSSAGPTSLTHHFDFQRAVSLTLTLRWGTRATTARLPKTDLTDSRLGLRSALFPLAVLSPCLPSPRTTRRISSRRLTSLVVLASSCPSASRLGRRPPHPRPPPTLFSNPPFTPTQDRTRPPNSNSPITTTRPHTASTRPTRRRRRLGRAADGSSSSTSRATRLRRPHRRPHSRWPSQASATRAGCLRTVARSMSSRTGSLVGIFSSR